MFSSPQNHPGLSHRHSFGGGEQIGWPPAQQHPSSHHGLHHTPGGGSVKMELGPSSHMQHSSHVPLHSMHTVDAGAGSASAAAGQQAFGMHHGHQHPQHQQHAGFSPGAQQHHPHQHPHSRASAPSLPVYPGIAHQSHPHTGSNLHQPHVAAPIPTHPGLAPQPMTAGHPVDPAAADASRDGRRATLPLAHADLELELQIRHNMLIEQQHRIAQLEEELSRSRLEIERLNAKARQYEQEKAKGTQKKAQSRYWTPEEHQRFLEGVEKYGAKDVKSIALHVGTRNATQVRTHAQKYYLRIDREKKRKEERESKEKEERKDDNEDGEIGVKDEAKAKTSSPDNRKRHSEPSPSLYKAAVLALLTHWTEDDYDTFVNGIQVFDSESNVQRRLQLIQEKLLPHKTLDELNAINEAIEQQANANRRKRMKMSDNISSTDDDLFASDIDGFRHDNMDTFSSGGFAAPYGMGNGEGVGRSGLSGRMAPSMAQSMAYGRRSSLPAFPVTHPLSHHRHQPLHSQHPLHPAHRSQHMPPPREQDLSQPAYSLPLSQQPAPHSGEATSNGETDDSAFSSFSQIITRHSSGTFAPPRSPVSSMGSSVPGRRMSAPNINLLAIEADYKQQQQNMRQRYSMQFDGSSQQSTNMPPPVAMDRRASMHSMDQTDFHGHDLHQTGLGVGHDAHHDESTPNAVHQRRHSLDIGYQHAGHDDPDQARRNADMTQPLHHEMVACHPTQPPSDNFDPSVHMSAGDGLSQREQGTDGMSGSFSDDVWSTRILGMAAGEQMPPPSSDDFSITPDSATDASSSAASSSTDSFGLLSTS